MLARSNPAHAPALQSAAARLAEPDRMGRLFKALVETKKATSASAFAGRQHDPGLFTASAEVPRDGAVDDVRDLLVATIEGAGATAFSAEEVNRAKQQILKARELAATDILVLARKRRAFRRTR